MKIGPKDYPIAECIETADKLIASGMTVYQKFTCCACGERITMDEPNKFYNIGKCECGAVTNILCRGCNYLVMFAIPAAR